MSDISLSTPSSPQKPPRGYVPLDAAAEILWNDDTDRPKDWFMAFLQVVVDSQGITGTGENVDVRLQWWRADGGGPTYVRANQIPSLRPFFLQWCGLPAAADNPQTIPKRVRGRPKGSAIASDSGLVNIAIQQFLAGEANSLTDAARRVAEHARGASFDAKCHRLRRKVIAEWKRRRGKGE